MNYIELHCTSELLHEIEANGNFGGNEENGILELYYSIDDEFDQGIGATDENGREEIISEFKGVRFLDSDGKEFSEFVSQLISKKLSK
jgi:hypothetical protein